MRASPAAHGVERRRRRRSSSIPEAIIAAGWPPSISLRYWSAISAISGETTTVRSAGRDAGQLVAEALAAAGGHHDEAVAPVERGLHRLALPGAELADSRSARAARRGRAVPS